MVQHVKWDFPLPRTHTGIMQGNACTGTLIWGEGSQLRITIGRADYWDHRGGMPWTENHNYRKIRERLEANDGAGLRTLFTTTTESAEDQPQRPSVLPVGRIDLDFGEGAELVRGELDLDSAIAAVYLRKGDKLHEIRFQLSMTSQIGLVELPAGLAPTITNVRAWDLKEEYFRKVSVEPPRDIDEDGFCGWIQALPVDPCLCVAWKQDGDNLWFCTARDAAVDAVLPKAKKLLTDAVAAGPTSFTDVNAGWWKAYWADVPNIDIPNDCLAELYRYGMYKFAGFSQPDGIAGTLQGPWIEEYELPPWSSDYHFNINVQMCYWPAFKGNRLEHLKPLFDLIFSWEEMLRHNAKVFLGIDDGLMLPHAVDDTCMCMRGFWTGCIDHGCTAWVAQMMYDYARYTNDNEFLRAKAFPFMKGAMRVYEEMLEKDGNGYLLPVSVSPEYRGAAMNAWGANASFQLACIHRLCENLIAAAERIGEEPANVWEDILDHAPKVCLIGDDGNSRIGLWEGTDLEESHKHHSHLAAITPFDTIDIYSDEYQPIVARSIRHWVAQGMGRWSGWCVPWASMLHARTGNGDMAELILEMWERVFTNKGHGTLHDCDFPGLAVTGAPRFGLTGPRCERMQLDAGFGAVAAIQDMVMHSRRGVLHIFPAVPARWKACSFGPMPCEGGFYISAVREDGRTAEVRIQATADEILKIADPWTGEVRELAMKAGKEKVLTRG